jgi:hypothetical protein
MSTGYNLGGGQTTMPAYDTFHDVVKRGLIKDGWTITDDPYTITYGGRDLYVNSAAGGPIAANRGDHLIAVEVERFNGASLLSDYHTALGRYVCHRLAMRTVDPRRVLFIALPRDTVRRDLRHFVHQRIPPGISRPLDRLQPRGGSTVPMDNPVCSGVVAEAILHESGSSPFRRRFTALAVS